ncbi:hypothetical protein EVAR_48383_1 [Eumeta japonica]|uniref:Uncharacterized protein n=1 Tax=Eumeta variegata TaxID=151549 RepID=A0A4C1Z8Y0_EUMVA|nr:hypothetical protein EVAR_48383_1 [Eumeta japonica]
MDLELGSKTGIKNSKVEIRKEARRVTARAPVKPPTNILTPISLNIVQTSSSSQGRSKVLQCVGWCPLIKQFVLPQALINYGQGSDSGTGGGSGRVGRGEGRAGEGESINYMRRFGAGSDGDRAECILYVLKPSAALEQRKGFNVRDFQTLAQGGRVREVHLHFLDFAYLGR